MKEQRARVRECRPQLACSLQRLIVNNRHQPLVKFNCGVYVCVPCLSVQKSYFLRGSCSFLTIVLFVVDSIASIPNFSKWAVSHTIRN